MGSTDRDPRCAAEEEDPLEEIVRRGILRVSSENTLRPRRFGSDQLQDPNLIQAWRDQGLKPGWGESSVFFPSQE